jgi:alpha-mannosidase
MPDARHRKLSEPQEEPLTRRAFLRGCGLAAGAVAVGLAEPGVFGAAQVGRGEAKTGGAARTFFVMPHSHIDVEWYWTFATTREWTADILNKALALMRRDPEYRFTQDQVVLVKSYWEGLGAEDRVFFKQMVAEGRLAIVGGMYVQPEVAEPSGEALVRQILVGQRWLETTLGVRARCGWLIDTFGQIPQLPQILRLAGYDAYVFWRDIPLDYPIDSLPADFYCESPDGTGILTHWLAGGYSFNNGLIRAIAEHSRMENVLVPYGSDVSRPRADSAAIQRDVATRMDKLGIAGGRLRVATAIEYFEALREAPGPLPVVRLDFNPPQRAQDLRGTYDNRIELKKRNRSAEQALYSAECLAAMASVGGHAYPAATLDELWEKLLFTHFHDIIGGSHSDPVNLGAMERLAAVLTGAEAMSAVSLRQVVPGAGGSGDWFIAFNTLSVARSEVCRMRIPWPEGAGMPAGTSQTDNRAGKHAGVPAGARDGLRLEDARGRSVVSRVVGSAEAGSPTGEIEIEFIAEDLPATGYRAYRLARGARREPHARRRIGSNCLENARYCLEWDPRTGDLTVLRDKRRGREVLAGPSNVLLFAREEKPNLEGNFHLTGEQRCSSDYAATSITPSQDDLALRVRSVTQLPDCVVEREIILWDGLERVDFRTTLGNFTGGDVLVKAAFAPRLDWRKVERVYETPFAATARPEGHYAARTWVDCSDGRGGVALLNRGTPGYWISDGQLELVLLRSLADYRDYQKNARGKGVPGYEHSPQTELAREQGTHQFEYALVPHAGNWRAGRLPELGLGYNTPLTGLAGLDAAAGKKAGGSFVACAPGFLVTAIKRAEDGHGLIVRGYETRGQPHGVAMRLPHEVRRVRRPNLLEESGETLSVSRGRVGFSCRPHEIVTLRLEW